MDALEAILTRRSIRKYTNQPVSPEHLETMLRAAMAAPSAGNAQDWRFVVLDDPALLARVPHIHPYGAMAQRAPLAILVCGDLTQEKYPGFWVQDCAAATQNILLAAHALGLGAVWTGLHPNAHRVEGFQKLLGLAESVVPLALVVVGHPDQEPGPADRYRPELVSHNRG